MMYIDTKQLTDALQQMIRKLTAVVETKILGVAKHTRQFVNEPAGFFSRRGLGWLRKQETAE